MRYLIILLAAMALALGACEAGDGTPAGTPGETLDIFGSPSPTGGASPTETSDASPTMTDGASPTGTADASPTGTADASPAGSPGTAGACEAAFEDVPDLDDVATLSDLRDFLDAVDETVQACESVEEWTQQAEQQLDLDDADIDAEDFLRARCDESETLSDTALCQEL